MTTLEEALTSGVGTERPFQCEVHNDTHDSASVNVVKMLWYCHACFASGSADGGKPPTDAMLAALLAEPAVQRVYPEAYLEVFIPLTTEGDHWATRYPDWLRWSAGLGLDPFTGDATFPVRTPLGQLAGVGRRKADGEPKYLYPPAWSASRVLGWTPVMPLGAPLVLVEGFSDALSLAETGIPAAAVYGAGLHLPQRQALLQRHKGPILLGFDNDDAGHRANIRTRDLMEDLGVATATVHWSAKDPGEISPEERIDAVATVVGSRYVQTWSSTAAALQELHHRHREEEDGQ